MRIGISTFPFRPGGIGGMETYLRNLLAELQGVDRENRYEILCTRRNAGEFALDNPAVATVPYPLDRPSPGWLARGTMRRYAGIDLLAPLINRRGLEVVHHPFTVLDPRGLRMPQVLTFHDMQHEFFPDFFAPWELNQRRATFRSSAEQATEIIAISNHARDSLVERYGIDSGRISVIYNGYGSGFRPLEPERLPPFREKYRLERPFMYYPAATWPHKNHPRLLAALKLLIDRHGCDGDLVLTGIAKSAHGELEREIARLGLAGRVRVLGYLPYEDLPLLYNAADLLVFPSLFEGFGIPVVEAMACGCPVASSDAASLPEVVGEAGLLFDPTSVEEMAATIGKLWEDTELRKGLSDLGLRRVKRFDWRENARQTVEVYRRAAARADKRG